MKAGRPPGRKSHGSQKMRPCHNSGFGFHWGISGKAACMNFYYLPQLIIDNRPCGGGEDHLGNLCGIQPLRKLKLQELRPEYPAIGTALQACQILCSQVAHRDEMSSMIYVCILHHDLRFSLFIAWENSQLWMG